MQRFSLTCSCQLDEEAKIAKEEEVVRWKHRQNTMVIRLRWYRGQPYVDIREFAVNKEGKLVPTRKGVIFDKAGAKKLRIALKKTKPTLS